MRSTSRAEGRPGHGCEPVRQGATAHARRIDSGLLRNDAKEWLVDFGFSVVTLAGFAVLPFLGEPHRSAWVSICLTADPRWV